MGFWTARNVLVMEGGEGRDREGITQLGEGSDVQ